MLSQSKIKKKLETACDHDIWFPIGQISTQDACAWNSTRQLEDYLFAVTCKGTQHAYVHYQPNSRQPKIFNGSTFGVMLCQFIKYEQKLYVILVPDAKHGECWTLPQHDVEFADFDDRVIDYNAIEKRLIHPSLSQSRAALCHRQTLDVEYPTIINMYKIRYELRILITKYNDVKPPPKHSQMLMMSPTQCTLENWFAEKPHDISHVTWLFVYCCYKKTTWQEKQLSDLQSMLVRHTLHISLPLSCLELTPEKLCFKFAKNTKYPGDKWEHTIAHIHARDQCDIPSTFKHLWFQRNKYGMLPLHTAILFRNTTFIENFCASPHSNDTLKLMFTFAYRGPVSPQEFTDIIESPPNNN